MNPTKNNGVSDLKKMVKRHINQNNFDGGNFHPNLDNQDRMLKYFDDEMLPEFTRDFEMMSKLFGFSGRAKVESMIMNSVGISDPTAFGDLKFRERCFEEGIEPERKIAVMKGNFINWATKKIREETQHTGTGHAPDWVK